jgi:hypothetical protein
MKILIVILIKIKINLLLCDYVKSSKVKSNILSINLRNFGSMISIVGVRNQYWLQVARKRSRRC